ncbi:type II toxin-antitoxin system VapC family toxin [Candidatus Electrothrix sp.]|uniref:type II toxin-antitoxin system VapC family toxin n=1 Tax=Candidatus Electrothrix sp. TaxID=2170559 RepID=UPI004056F07A
MKIKTVYIETSIVSYLTARPTNDLLAAAWQKITSDWWYTQRSRFILYTSGVVTEEAGRGNPEAAARRLNALSDIQLLAIPEAVVTLSKALLKESALPAKALDDSLHIAIAAVHGVDYLLTWNCRHIDNAETKPVMRKVCAAHGYACAEICTPQELMGVNKDGR